MKRQQKTTRKIDVPDYTKPGKDGSYAVVRKPDTQQTEDEVVAEYFKAPASKEFGEG